MTTKKTLADQIQKLSPQQIQAIDMLIAGRGVVETALELGIAYETLSRWRNHDAAFIAACNARRYLVWESNAERLRQLATKAVAVIDTLLDSEKESVRLKAAQMVLAGSGLHQIGRPSDRIEPKQVENDIVQRNFQEAMSNVGAMLNREKLKNDDLLPSLAKGSRRQSRR